MTEISAYLDLVQVQATESFREHTMPNLLGARYAPKASVQIPAESVEALEKYPLPDHVSPVWQRAGLRQKRVGFL